MGATKWLKEKEEADSYGSHKSQREVILYDNEDQIPITVWKNVLDEFAEETLYIFQFISLKNYYGSKLTKTKSTIVSDEREVPYTLSQETPISQLNLTKTDHSITPKVMFSRRCYSSPLCFPRLYKKACGKLVVVIPDEATTTCLQCNTTMELSKCYCVFHCNHSVFGHFPRSECIIRRI